MVTDTKKEECKRCNGKGFVELQHGIARVICNCEAGDRIKESLKPPPKPEPQPVRDDRPLTEYEEAWKVYDELVSRGTGDAPTTVGATTGGDEFVLPSRRSDTGSGSATGSNRNKTARNKKQGGKGST